jgi:hypothetical protein
MIAMVDRINEKPKFRGKHKIKTVCQWLTGKTYIIESNDDSDSDSDSDSDYDNGELINGNKPVLRIIHLRRPGIFQLFKI